MTTFIPSRFLPKLSSSTLQSPFSNLRLPSSVSSWFLLIYRYLLCLLFFTLPSSGSFRFLQTIFIPLPIPFCDLARLIFLPFSSPGSFLTIFQFPSCILPLLLFLTLSSPGSFLIIFIHLPFCNLALSIPSLFSSRFVFNYLYPPFTSLL
jgi:hypothetical protein